MLTKEVVALAVSTVAPKAKKEYLDAILSDSGIEQMNFYGINTPLRLVHFIAQIAHESNLLTALRENMNYSAKRIREVFGIGRHSAGVTDTEAVALAGRPYDLAERVYGLGNARKAKELGNIMRGDGYDFRGTGPLGTTGRKNFQRVADKLKQPIIMLNPQIMLQPEFLLQPALIFWDDHDLNLKADQNDIDFITEIINGGFNGIADRRALLMKLSKAVLGTAEPWKIAKPNPEVVSLQEKLNALGYKITVDGLNGNQTIETVKKFQTIAGIPVDGSAGPVTLSAIDAALNRNATPRQEPRKEDDNQTMASGATITGFGAASEILMTSAREIGNIGVDSTALKLIPIALMLFGVALTVYPILRRAKSNA